MDEQRLGVARRRLRGERLTRLRWRLRGAWLWPTFAGATAAEAVLLNELPIWGDGPGGLLPGALIAGFLNLALVAGAAPLAGRLLRRRRPDLPRTVAADYGGTVLIAVLFAVLVAAGVIHRPAVVEEQGDRLAQAAAVIGYVTSQEPEFEPGLERLDTMRLSDDVYRSCVPGEDPKRWLCLFVETDQHPAGVTRDPDGSPNAVYQRHGGFE